MQMNFVENPINNHILKVTAKFPVNPTKLCYFNAAIRNPANNNNNCSSTT